MLQVCTLVLEQSIGTNRGTSDKRGLSMTFLPGNSGVQPVLGRIDTNC